MYNLKYIMWLYFTLSIIDFALLENKEIKRLQIGIKKRPKNCTDKSKKGDLLHVHYKISWKNKQPTLSIIFAKHLKFSKCSKIYTLKGIFENGTEFDTSYVRQIPFTFTVGSGQVIKGWDQGLIGMCTGELRKLVIPPELGYGEHGVPPIISGNTTLIFHIELVKIERKNEQQI